MTTLQEIIAAKRRAMIPSRLLRGAEILGDLWRSGVRCKSGWASGCSCKEVGGETDFCVAKQRWVALYIEHAGFEVSGWLAFNEPFGVIEAMSVRQFDATGLTVLVEVLGTKTPIRVGPRGTCWQTIVDLGAIDATKDYGSALTSVLKIQGMMS